MELPVIFGVKTGTKTVERGNFNCPWCRDVRAYQVVVTTSTFHVFFVPLGPASEIERYVYCDACGHDFPPELLQGDRAPEFEHRMFAFLLLRLAIDAARVEDGLTPEKIQVIQAACQRHIGRPDTECVIEEVRCMDNEGKMGMDHLQHIGSRLAADEKERVLLTIADVFSKEDLTEKQVRFTSDVASAMELSVAEIRSLGSDGHEPQKT
jgi:hypothetical protein